MKKILLLSFMLLTSCGDVTSNEETFEGPIEVVQEETPPNASPSPEPSSSPSSSPSPTPGNKRCKKVLIYKHSVKCKKD